MKKRKILLLIPAFGLLLSGCTFQEGFATAKHWVGQNIYHPLKDWIKGLIGGGGEEKPTPDPGPSTKQYTVSFDANGGTGSMAAVTDVTGEYTLPACTFTAPEGKVFDGWKVGAEGEVKNAGDKITVSANITLYAQWRETAGEKYTVTFNVQGHGTAPASQSIDDGGKVTKPTDPSAEGWTFGGWFKEAGCTNPWDFNGDVVSAPTTLYAKWTQIAPVEGSILYSIVNPSTDVPKNLNDLESDAINGAFVTSSSDKVIKGVKSFTNCYFGGNGGSEDQGTAFDIKDCLKIGKSAKNNVSGHGSITLELDESISFTSLKLGLLCSRDDGELTINGVNKSVTNKAAKDNVTPVYTEFEVASGAESLVLTSKEATTGNFAIWVTSIEFVGTGKVTPPVEPTVSEVKLDKYEMALEVEGDDGELTATVLGENDPSQEVTWHSDHPEIASVSEKGKVHALAKGTANITAKSVLDSTKESLPCVVTVTEPEVLPTVTEVTVTGPTKTTYTEGDHLDLTGLVVTAHYDQGEPKVIESGWTSNPEDGAVLGLSDTSLVVTYKGVNSEPIALTIEKAPVVDINSSEIATSEFESSYKNNIEHFVADETGLSVDATGVLCTTKEDVKYIQLQANTGELWNGSPITGGLTEISFTLENSENVPLVYVGTTKNPHENSVTPENGVYKISGNYSYFTIASNSTKATLISAITVKYNGTIPSYTIPASKVELNKSAIELGIDDTFQLTSSVLPTAAADHTVTWTSSDPSVATVSTSGLVTGKSDGNVTITASCDGVNGICAVSVSSTAVKAYASYITNPGTQTGELSDEIVLATFTNNCTGTNIVSAASASKAYSEGDALKFGGSSSKGSLTLTLSKAMKRVVISVKAYNNNAEALSILVNDTEYAITKDYTDVEISLSAASTSFTFISKIQTKNRFFIRSMDFYE